MKRSVRYLISTLTLAALVAVFLAICAGNSRKRSLLTCEGVRVSFADDYRFVTEEDVKGYLDKYYGAYIGQRMDSIRLHEVESILDMQSAILKSEAYATDDGMLNISITQREPVIRFQKDDLGFYADECGFIFPLQENYTSNVHIIDGNVPISFREGFKGQPVNEKEQQWMKGVLELLKCMDDSRTWSENIVQIHVESNGDLTLVPREGRERFIFGPPVRIAGKFSLMDRYYRSVKPEVEDNLYKTVTVKYEGQIICRK